MLAIAYTIAYLVADAIAPLPPVSGRRGSSCLSLTAPFVWLAVFTAYNLYDNDSLRISVSSFDEVRDLFHAMLVGSLGYLILSQGVDYFFGWWVYTAVEALLFLGRRARARSDRARHDPKLGLPARDDRRGGR